MLKVWMKNKLAMFLAINLVWVLAGPVRATPVADTAEFEFSGFIDAIYSNENNALGNVYINQPFEGWFTYSSVPDQYPGSAYTGYYHQDASIIVTLGTQTLSYIDDFVYIRVYNWSEDKYSFGVDASQGDFNFTSYGVLFSDSTGTVFNNDYLPMSLDLAQFDQTELIIAGYKMPNHDWFQVVGEITNITLIPEPASILLLGLGGLALRLRSGQALLRKRKK